MNHTARWLAPLLAIALAVAATAAPAQDQLVRGPYLQSMSGSRVIVRWRTASATDSRVRYGTSPSSLTLGVDDATLTTEHRVVLTGLVPGRRYFYSIGSSAEVLAGGDAAHRFVTAPPAPPLDPVRLWAIGDSGTAHQQQLDPGLGEVRDAQGVRDAFMRYAGIGSTLVAASSPWRYLDDGSDLGAAWRDPGFDDTGWSSGRGELGYGDGDEATVVSCGPGAPACSAGNFVTTYFRHRFQVSDPSAFAALTLAVLRDDGAVAYLNGVEVMRSNMPAGPILASTPASSAIGSTDEHLFHRVAVDPGLLVAGDNVLAVEVHQRSDTSSDISFHAELLGMTAAGVPPRLLLMAGDNAYNVGTDDEWQRAVFDPYATLLRATALWPVLGNHDIGTLDGQPYLDAMSLPRNAEAGGVASGTEAYYSFDHANVHVIALDSTHSAARQPGSAMLTWLASDLAATTKDWIIAIWHHPPYSKGSHDSDDPVDDLPLVEMRENVLPLLEAGGVDLVLAGHSHSYERSMLIDGFYATPTLIDDGTVVDAGGGDAFADGHYSKSATGPIANAGTVYGVVGSSGRNNPALGALDHPVMHFSIHDLGSLVIDVDGNRLDGAFIDRTCAAMHDPSCVLDRFSMVKGAPRAGYVRLASARAAVPAGDSLPLTLTLENITNGVQSYVFGLVLIAPGGGRFTLVLAPLSLPARFSAPVPIALPIGPTLVPGSWSLVGFLLTTTGELVDASFLPFAVE